MRRTLVLIGIVGVVAFLLVQASVGEKKRYGEPPKRVPADVPLIQLECMDWYILLDYGGYSDYWFLKPHPTFHCVPNSHEVLSGEWGAAIYYAGLDSAMWLTHLFTMPDWITNSTFSTLEFAAWDDPANPASSNPYFDTGRSVITNGTVEIRQDFEIADLVQHFASPLGTRELLPIGMEVSSSRYVLLQTTTIKNVTQDTLFDVELYQMLHGHPGDQYGPIVNTVYDPILHADSLLEAYAPFNPVHAVGNFRYDITQWNYDPQGNGWIDWIGFSSVIPPDAFGNNFYSGHSGKPPPPGTHWDIEGRALNGVDSLYGEIAGATTWELPDLAPGDSTGVTVVLMNGTVDCNDNGIADICDIENNPGLDLDSSGVIDECEPCYVQSQSIDFGVVIAGNAKEVNFVIENNSRTNLSGTVSESCDHYCISHGGGSYVLAPGASRVVTVRFAPNSPGTHLCTIDTGNSLCENVSCTGEASLEHGGWKPDGVVMCSAVGGQYYYQGTISDGTGGAISVWQDPRGADDDIYAQRVDTSGDVKWTTDGVGICLSPGNQQWSRLCSDSYGGAIVCWVDRRSGTDSHIYAQRVDAAGILLWPADGVPVCTTTTAVNPPYIVSDGAGGAVIAWSNNDIYAQRVDSLGNPLWTTDGVAICVAANDQKHPKIVSDGVGGAITSWYDKRNGNTNTDIYAQRIDELGNTLWTTDGAAICTAAYNQLSHSIISDGMGGAIVAWTDPRNLVRTVYAQRIDASGNVMWPTDGVAISGIEPDPFPSPDITTDGAGGAIIAWIHPRFSGGIERYDDVYAQRVDFLGNVLWSPDGIAVCSNSDYQFDPDIVSDDVGGAIIAWTGRYSKNVYAQRADASGNPLWSAEGVAMRLTPYDGGGGAGIVSDGSGGAIVTWSDLRGCDDGIYAQRVYANGSVVTSAVHESYLSVDLHQNYPNPFNPTTTIGFSLDREATVTLSIYDVTGRQVRTLVNRRVTAGMYSQDWDGRDAGGSPVASGVYFYRLSVGDRALTKKMVLIR
jgi:hypothetical protein